MPGRSWTSVILFFYAIIAIAAVVFMMGCSADGTKGKISPYVNRFLTSVTQDCDELHITVKMPEGYIGLFTYDDSNQVANLAYRTELSDNDVIDGCPVQFDTIVLVGLEPDRDHTFYLDLVLVVPTAEPAFGTGLSEELSFFMDTVPDGCVPVGEQGPAGPPGAPGTPGQDGVNGADGSDGTNGQDGQDGNDGADGQDGNDGADGQDGENGEDGQDGSDGEDGEDYEPPLPDPCLPSLIGLPTGGSMTINSGRLQTTIDNLHMGGKARIDVTEDYLTDNFDSYWKISAPDGIGPVEGDAAAIIIIELAGFKNGNLFGVYDPADPAVKVVLFDGPDGKADTVLLTILTDGSILLDDVDTCVDFSSDRFGFFLDSSAYARGGLFYSDSSLNAGGADYAAFYQGDGDVIINPPGDYPYEVFQPDEWIIGWEDLRICVDEVAACGGPVCGSDLDYEDMVILMSGIRPSLCVSE